MITTDRFLTVTPERKFFGIVWRKAVQIPVFVRPTI